jgi:DNA-binding CsgD family transcriptional regulator
MAGKQIARSLGISPKTVEQHKTRAFKRLGVPNQAAAVAMLVEKGARSWSASTT